MSREGKKSLFTSDNKEFWPGLRILVVKPDFRKPTSLVNHTLFATTVKEDHYIHSLSTFIFDVLNFYIIHGTTYHSSVVIGSLGHLDLKCLSFINAVKILLPKQKSNG